MKIVFVFLIVCGCSLSAWAEELIIQTQKSRLVFDVKIADTPEKATKGLMFQTHLAKNEGMLFVDKTDRVWHMWMKNTLIPLDMIFIARDGSIVKIIANATPHDLTLLSSDQAVGGVLEIGGGVCDQMNIQVGDKVISDRL